MFPLTKFGTIYASKKGLNLIVFLAFRIYQGTKKKALLCRRIAVNKCRYNDRTRKSPPYNPSMLNPSTNHPSAIQCVKRSYFGTRFGQLSLGKLSQHTPRSLELKNQRELRPGDLGCQVPSNNIQGFIIKIYFRNFSYSNSVLM